MNKNKTTQLGVCLIGAGIVLQKEDDTICESNIHSITTLLDDLKINISASSLGGNCRRTVSFDIEKSEVFIPSGDSGLTLMHRF